MKKIRVLICDDSLPVRRILRALVDGEPDLVVVAAASNGEEALALIKEHDPEVVILDVEMPVMDGLTTLQEIRKFDRLLPIIMFSASTQRGAQLTFRALAMGANDYVAKPSNMGGLEETRQHISQQMLPLIRAFVERFRGLRRRRPGRGMAPPEGRGFAAPAGRSVTPLRPPQRPSMPGPRPPAPRPPPSPSAGAQAAELAAPQRPQGKEEPPHQRAAMAPSASPRRGKPVRLVALGISTGGPGALASLLPALPANFPVPIVIVQHMPPVFTSLLAERLDEQCRLTVREGVDGALVRPGEVWIAPGDFHMEVRALRGEVRLKLSQGAKEHSCRPAVDVLFRSVAESHGAAALGVVMTGMGSDGALGAVALRQRGARVLIQDQASCVVWGMPGAVARLGAYDEMHALEELPLAIQRQLSGASAAGQAAAQGRSWVA